MTDTSINNATATHQNETDTNIKKAIHLVPIPVEKQNKDTIYKMKLNFALDVGIKSLDGILDECGFSERPTLKNAVNYTIEQTVPFIPDKETIQTYCDIIKKERQDHINIRSAVFTGYEYLYPVRPEESEEPEKCE